MLETIGLIGGGAVLGIVVVFGLLAWRVWSEPPKHGPFDRRV